MRKAAWLVHRELVSEARSFERTSTLALFAVAVLVTFHFTLPPDADARPQVAGGFMWATIVFASLFELRRSFESERREGTLDGLRVAPIEAGVVFVSKLASNLIVVGLLVVALAPLTALFFGGRAAGIPAAIGVGLLGALGLLAWGTLFAAAGGGRSGEVLLPLVLFPLVVPQTIAAVRLLSHYLGGGQADDPITAFVLLGATAMLSVGTSLLLFEYVVEE